LNMFKLLDRYFTGEHDETYLEKFAEAAPGYVERSLKALNLPYWDTLRYQLKKAAALLSINHPDEAEHIETLLATEEGNASNRASILVTCVWPMLNKTVKGDSRMAEMCGFTPEDWLKLDLTSQSREYARAKKDGRLADIGILPDPPRPKPPTVSIQNVNGKIEY
jgi:hypothetical protein